MEVRIGTTLDGQVAWFDTGNPAPLLLVGDGGRGKTTTARYLTRWWLADIRRHVHVYSPAPSEWADRQNAVELPDQLDRPVGDGCPHGTCLVVVDGLEVLDDDQLGLLPWGRGRTILTSHGGNSLSGRPPLLMAGLACIGLVRPDPSDPAEIAVLDGQGRLDWPADTTPVIADQRGSIDFPCHRWRAPVGAWMAAPR